MAWAGHPEILSREDLPFSDAERARRWMQELMARSRCEL
jgi:hypothetical protein